MGRANLTCGSSDSPNDNRRDGHDEAPQSRKVGDEPSFVWRRSRENSLEIDLPWDTPKNLEEKQKVMNISVSLPPHTGSPKVASGNAIQVLLGLVAFRSN